VIEKEINYIVLWLHKNMHRWENIACLGVREFPLSMTSHSSSE